MIEVQYQHLGSLSYEKAWDYQTELHNQIKQRKLDNRNAENPVKQEHFFLMCEHPPVYTLGKSGKESNLLINEDFRTENKIEYFKINRGGDITFHGPGQVVGYPILDLDELFTDVHQYVRYIEEVIIRTCASYGIEAKRIEGFTGVWVEDNVSQRKICAIGVHLSRWVTMHGFAFNINTDLNYFNHIIPCGISESNKKVTSLQQELDRHIPLEEVRNQILYHFSEIFEVKMI